MAKKKKKKEEEKKEKKVEIYPNPEKWNRDWRYSWERPWRCGLKVKKK